MGSSVGGWVFARGCEAEDGIKLIHLLLLLNYMPLHMPLGCFPPFPLRLACSHNMPLCCLQHAHAGCRLQPALL